MYCSNCGSKLGSCDIFCSECGNKRQISMKDKKGRGHFSIKKFSLSSNEKKVIIIILIFVIMVFVYSLVNRTMFCEDEIIKRYVRAYARNDYEEIIDLSDINKNEFMSEGIVVEKYGRPTDDKVDVEILSTNSNSGEHTRTVQYSKGSGRKNILNLSVKRAGHKFGIFNNYVITSTNLTAEDISITIPRSVSLKVDGVNMSDKYKSSSADSNNNNYKIKEVLSKNVMLEIILKNDVKITSVRNFFDNESITLNNCYNNSIDADSKEKVIGKVKNAISVIVDGAILGKGYSELDLTSVYSSDLLGSSVFSSSYETLKSKIVQSQPKDFKITSIDINNIYLKNEDVNKLEFNCKVNYSYKNKSDQLQNSSRNVKMILDNGNGLKVDEFYLVSLYSLF